MQNSDRKSHAEWIKERDASPVGSEPYQRAQDYIGDIQGDTNNKQVGNLSDFLKDYKTETDKNIRNTKFLAWVSIGITLAALLVQAIDIVASSGSRPAMTIQNIAIEGEPQMASSSVLFK